MNRRSPLTPQLVAYALALVAVASCSDAPTDQPEPLRPPNECTVAVIASDFASTALSLVTDDGQPCRDDVLHSGSAAPGLVNALSGDVVLPSTATSGSEVVLIDRFPNAVLTFVGFDDDAHAVVRGQLSVATGFASNPHDYLEVGPSRAYVSRHASNPNPTAELDGGGDLLVINPDTLGVLGRVDLGSDEPAGIDPRPSRMALANGLIWVGLARLSRDFDRVASGRVVAVDPATDTVVATVDLDNMVNCGGALVAGTPDADGIPGIWVSCAGHFTNGVIDPTGAGVAYIDVRASPPQVTLSLDATALGQTPGWGLAATPTGVLVTTFGKRDATEDQLVHVDQATGRAALLPVMTTAFQFGSLVRTPERWLVLDADPFDPRMWVSGQVDATGFAATWTSTPFVTSSGLPPRHALRLP